METTQISRLDRTLKALQDRVKEQEAVLEELRATTTSTLDSRPSANPFSHLRQIRSLSAAYESLIPQDPYLPSHDSLLPALLALRSTQTCICETEESISKTEEALKKTRNQLEEEQASLTDAKLIQASLGARISSLQGRIDERSQRTPGQMAKEMIREMKSRKTHHDRETGKLVKAFNGFIDEHLAPLLAAEELGGPIVGEMLDVDEEMLEAGFSAQGKVRKTRKGVNEDKRQRRIDEIWGPRPDEDGDEDEDEETREPWDEKRAAAAEMRDLTEQLLNCLVEADAVGTGPYVELERESAASRFLVRSKVAQFHPKDAKRLRLVDFGGELED